jgi:hypothetical protein
MLIKATLASDDFVWMANFNNTKFYYDFFEDFMFRWKEKNYEKRINIAPSVNPTIVVPGDYSQQDGLNFYQMVLNQVALQSHPYKSIAKPEADFYCRWIDTIPTLREYFLKPFQYMCSAGNMMFGLGESDNELHNCHRTYYIKYPGYIEGMKKHSGDLLTIDGLDKGRNSLMLASVANSTDEKSVIKFLWRNRAFRDFAKQRSATGVAIGMELASAGQISKCYKLPEMSFLLNAVGQLMDCQMDHIIANASLSIPSLGMFRLYGNGAFENALSRSRGVL